MSDDEGLTDSSVDHGYGDLVRSSSSSGNSQTYQESGSTEENRRDDTATIVSTFEWSERGLSVLRDQQASPIEYDPDTTLSNGLPYVIGRSSVSEGLDNTGARIRPDLHQKIEQAVMNMGQYFNESPNKSDYYEAALTVALWHNDEVLALLSEMGYGMRE